MKRLLTFGFAASLMLAMGASAVAHHSAAAFDTQKEVRLTGKVTVYRFANPHVYLTMEVKKDDGKTITSEVEAGAASVLNGLGFHKNSVKVGEVVTVVGNPSRKEGEGKVLGKDLFKEDGSYVPLYIGSKSVYAAREAKPATSLSGTWFSPREGFMGFLGGGRTWKINEAGRKAMAAANDPKATVQKDCIPIGEPALMFYPVASKIDVQKDKVIIKVDWMDSERVVYLDGRKRPAPTQTFLHGFSLGRWEGKTLVVETTNFKEHPMGNSSSLPSSTQKKLTERFTLAADGRSIEYSGTIEDPTYLDAPVPFAGKFEYRPNMPFSNQKCDVQVARKFLADF